MCDYVHYYAREQEKIVMKIREFLASFEVKSLDQQDDSDDCLSVGRESDTENNEEVAVVRDVEGDIVNAQQNDSAKSNEISVLKKLE